MAAADHRLGRAGPLPACPRHVAAGVNDMNVLVTAGNTQTPIDRVRCITNVFTGRTGAQVALEAHHRGHAVTLLTSHPEVVRKLAPDLATAPTWTMRSYRTFVDLQEAMSGLVPGGRFDVLIHAAAVSDYA